MTGVSTMGQALRQIELIGQQQRLYDSLSVQLTTGKKTQAFSGLGNDVLLSQRARADFSSLDNFINNIDRSNTRIKLTLDAIEEFKAQAENFLEALVSFPLESDHQKGDIVYYDDPLTPDVDEHIPVGYDSAEPSIELEGLQDLANNLFGFAADLLNLQDGDRYLLHGSETLTQPYNDNGIMDAAVSSLIAGWKDGSITTQELIGDIQGRDASTNPNALTDTIVGYSAALSQGTTGNIYVRVSEVTEFDTTALANDTGFRDVMVALSFFRNENLAPLADAYIPPNTPASGVPDVEGVPGDTLEEMRGNFATLFQSMTATVSNAIDNIDQLRFELESVRAQIDEVRGRHVQSQSVLLSTISDVEDANVNEVALQLNTLQIQLDASFRVTARARELSLVNFI